MSVLAQGTQVFFIDPAGSSPTVTEVDCPTAFNPGGAPADQLEDTCLSATDRSYRPGLRTPGQASLTVNADPDSASHIRLYELYETDPSPTLKWAVAWSDGTSVPTVDSAGDFDLPTDRTFYIFEGYVSDFPFDFQLNSIVSSEISIQRSGGGQWIKKV